MPDSKVEVDRRGEGGNAGLLFAARLDHSFQLQVYEAPGRMARTPI